MTQKQAFLESGRLAPQAVELEEAVLGQIMLENQSLDEVGHLLSCKVFYKEQHQYIFQAIQNLKGRDQPFDILLVSNELKQLGLLEKAGGPYYVTQLTSRIASSANIAHHAGVIFQKYVLREIIRMSQTLLNDAYEDTIDAFALSENALQEFESLVSITDSMVEVDTISAVDKTIADTTKRNDVNAIGIYETGIKGIDNIVGICPNELLLIAGPAGAGKTRLVIALMESLLSRYKDISIQWFSFEDPKEKIIRCFASINMLLKEEHIKGKKGKMNDHQMNAFLAYMKEFRKYDIVFVEDTKYIKQVGSMFSSFCKTRPGRFNICIIDNLLLLEDNTQDRDDIIAKELNRMRKRTGGLVIPVHHFNDEQMSKEMIKHAYRPRVVHLKGRESYRRACTQILLINKPGNYADLVAEYKGMEEILHYLYLIDIAKNRDGSANDDAETLIRLWAELDFLIFKDI